MRAILKTNLTTERHVRNSRLKQAYLAVFAFLILTLISGGLLIRDIRADMMESNSVAYANVLRSSLRGLRGWITERRLAIRRTISTSNP